MSHSPFVGRPSGGDEVPYGLCLRARADVLQAARLFDAAHRHDDDKVGQFHRLFPVIRHEDGRQAGGVVDSAQTLSQFLADAGVECAEGLADASLTSCSISSITG